MTNARRHLLIASAATLGAGCANAPAAPFSLAERVAQVRAAETAFAQSMADRNLAAFASFVADDAVFINGGSPLRGRAAIVEDWTRLFAPGPAPFAWKPALVEVVASGSLGYTEGPVTAADGAAFAKFYSTWRRSDAGVWQVVFDNGYSFKTCASGG
jgi:ketosteroid isomerase-like protein